MNNKLALVLSSLALIVSLGANAVGLHQLSTIKNESAARRHTIAQAAIVLCRRQNASDSALRQLLSSEFQLSAIAVGNITASEAKRFASYAAILKRGGTLTASQIKDLDKIAVKSKAITAAFVVAINKEIDLFNVLRSVNCAQLRIARL